MKEQYPRGKLCEEDEGDTQIAIYTRDNTIIMKFQKPVSWIGFDNDLALNIAEAIIYNANQINEKSNKQ